MKIVIPKELVKLVIKYIISLVNELAEKSDNPYDDMLAQFLTDCEPILLELIDQVYEIVK